MDNQTDQSPTLERAGATPASRVAFERLRERTDELELIISGMLAFALLTVPRWIFDTWASNDVHVVGMFEYVFLFAFMIGVGLSYSLAFAFIAHLAIRGYWVGLIGLKSTFPEGIRWDQVPFLGVVSRPFHEARVGDLGSAIDRVDRAASILFAMAILVAMLMAWVGVLAIAGILLAGLVGSFFDDGDRVTRNLLLAGYVAFVLLGTLPLVLERLIAHRQRAGDDAPRLQGGVRALLRIAGFLIPYRLIMPVQLTLNSNLPSRAFMAVYFLVLMVAMAIGGLQIVGSASFSMFNRYDVVTGQAVDRGMLSAHYESLRSDRDALLRYPMIPADRIGEAHLRLFIPHQPRRDNALARERCTALDRGINAARGEQATILARECIGALWTVQLDGQPVPLDDFVPIERRDLGMRGLVGYIPVAALPPGRHDLHLAWNDTGGDSGPMRRRDYWIPFWFTPGVDQGVATH